MFKTFKYIYFLLFTILLCTSCNSELLNKSEKEWLNQQQSIKIAIYPYYPPYQLIDKNGEINGVFPEYLELIEKKIGYTFEKVIFNTWPDLMNAVRAKEVDLIMEIHPTSDRESYLNFYAKAFETPHVIVTRNDDSYDENIEDFFNKKIILPKDYAIAENLKNKYPQLNIIFGENDLECLKRLNKGEFDAYIGPKSVANYQIKTKKLDNLAVIAKTEFNYSSGIAVYKTNSVLNTIIAKATKDISQKETKKIIENWTFSIVKPYYKTTKFWVNISLGIAALLLIISLLNFYLKYKIKQKTKELQIAKDKAEESNRIKTNFIQNISHEIRTPMNGIMGFSELMKNDTITESEQKEFAEIIINSGKELITSVDNILEISKLETSNIPLELENTNLALLLDGIVSNYTKQSEQKGLQLFYENKIPNKFDTLLLDKPKISKILTNFIDNSIKFTNKGEITISTYIENEYIVFKISDTGIGIKPKDQEIIFQSFSQSEKEISKNFGGLGLGLAIAKKNIDLMKGKVTFISEENKGSTFNIYIPLPYGRK